ncbi:uncharacterized protein LOC135360409 [Latimeria chalumnae]|uniref:uncharacterized protein LOC135360409 n=1 Tax=Latimeria chalumnae TaxID=7897 RepID=UPI00313C7368
MPATNSTAPEDSPPTSLSPTNPFFDALQTNPFIEDFLANPVLKSPTSTHSLSSFPWELQTTSDLVGNVPTLTEHDFPASLRTGPDHVDFCKGVQSDDQSPVPASRPSLQYPSPPPLHQSNPFSPTNTVLTVDWDESFDAFAASRLNSKVKTDGVGSPFATAAVWSKDNLCDGDQVNMSEERSTNPQLNVEGLLTSRTEDVIQEEKSNTVSLTLPETDGAIERNHFSASQSRSPTAASREEGESSRGTRQDGVTAEINSSLLTPNTFMSEKHIHTQENTAVPSPELELETQNDQSKTTVILKELLVKNDEETSTEELKMGIAPKAIVINSSVLESREGLTKTPESNLNVIRTFDLREENVFEHTSANVDDTKSKSESCSDLPELSQEISLEKPGGVLENADTFFLSEDTVVESSNTLPSCLDLGSVFFEESNVTDDKSDSISIDMGLKKEDGNSNVPALTPSFSSSEPQQRLCEGAEELNDSNDAKMPALLANNITTKGKTHETKIVGLQKPALEAKEGLSPPKPPRLVTTFRVEERELENDWIKHQSHQSNESHPETKIELQCAKEDDQQINPLKNEAVSLAASDNYEAIKTVISKDDETGRPPAAVVEDRKPTVEVSPSNVNQTGGETTKREIFGEDTEAEQFKMCLSKFSLEGAELARGDKVKLDVLQLALASDLITAVQTKRPAELDPVQGTESGLLEQTALVKLTKELGSEDLASFEPGTALKKEATDHSGLLFLSAVDEQPIKPYLGVGQVNVVGLAEHNSEEQPGFVAAEVGKNAVLKMLANTSDINSVQERNGSVEQVDKSNCKPEPNLVTTNLSEQLIKEQGYKRTSQLHTIPVSEPPVQEQGHEASDQLQCASLPEQPVLEQKLETTDQPQVTEIMGQPVKAQGCEVSQVQLDKEAEQPVYKAGFEATNAIGQASVRKEPRRSADAAYDFKSEEFWQVQSKTNDPESTVQNTSEQMFTSLFQSSKNPFVEMLPPSQSTPFEGFREGSSFQDLHLKAAPQGLQPTNLSGDKVVRPFWHGSQPLAASTPSSVAAANLQLTHFPSPILSPTNLGPPALTTQAAAAASLPCTAPQASGVKPSALVVLPQETRPADQFLQQQRHR